MPNSIYANKMQSFVLIKCQMANAPTAVGNKSRNSLTKDHINIPVRLIKVLNENQ